MGATADAWSETSWSNPAPASDGSSLQNASAFSQSSAFGANGRPARYSMVVSSGAIRPARPPASMDMLHTVMRPSIDSSRIARPVYSIAWFTAPPLPIREMM